MDLSSPLATVTPTLDAGVLQVLTATTSACTAGEVHRRLGRGSDEGVRKVLARLVRQGIVDVEGPGRYPLYRFNRDHLAAPHIQALATLRADVIDHLQRELNGWVIPSVHAGLFGSFARGEADNDSDIDILLVCPTLHAPEDEDRWVAQLDRLEHRVQAWTGNRAQIIAVSEQTLKDMIRSGDPLIESWRADVVHLAGERLPGLLRRAR